MKPNVGDILELNIDRLTYNGGRGLGRHLNFVIFVPDTAPGDTVSVKITEAKKNYAVAKLIQILNPGPNRITPKCQYYKFCGGCQLQHITYAEQISQKTSFLLKTIKNLRLELTTKVIPSPQEFYYRNRIQLHKKNNKVGYYKKNSHELIPVDKCIIAHKNINKALPSITGNSDRIEIALTTDERVITRNPKKADANNLFSQINNGINNLLINYVANHAEGSEYSIVYDAYCGQGNFTFPLYKKLNSTQFIGIEYSSQNIKAAKKENSNINFIESTVEKYFQQNPALPNSLIVLDPPRAGCHKSIFKNIKSAKKIIYISCDLSTFERDAKILLQNGFNLNELTGFDMFPQTSHIEVCGIFEKQTH